MMILELFRSVIAALGELEGDRKCFRVVGGVLVERTVKEVIPAVSSNLENVSVVIQSE